MAGASLRFSLPGVAAAISKNGGSAGAEPAKSRVLVLGGTGRVGGSTAVALSKLLPDLRILVGGRNRFAFFSLCWQEKGAALVSKLGENSEFVEVNIDDASILEAALKDVDLVVHAAGPFQRKEKCTVLEAAISTKTAYVDVCDDTDYARRAKGFHKEAIAAGVPAITTAGIYPGVSNVMAAELVRAAKSENAGEPERLRFFYYTAGSGGAGPTILATSFLLLGEDVIAYNKGKQIKLKPYSGGLTIDFGKGVKKKDVYLLNLPEVRSAHEILAVVNFLPPDILRDKKKVQKLVELIDPLVRAIDGIAGQQVSMRVDLECSKGRNTLSLFTHRNLSISVGFSVAAFALAVLEGSTQPGVWFPEEPEGIAVEAREVLLDRAAQGTVNFIMNKPPWMVETDPKEIGLGIYV
uniref:Saccharopine dehydrogenase NADP binding domain-containing protein n=1 Tax=Ananas comosus var. bracteatus TaxID=296719 RepID=A0A6V7NTL8_ANACO|nr:unnamed protein product [Ananas comosus var. bracteatus]